MRVVQERCNLSADSRACPSALAIPLSPVTEDKSISLSTWELVDGWVHATYIDVSRFGSEFIRFRAQCGQEVAWLKLRTLTGTIPLWIYFLAKVCREVDVDPRAVLYRSGTTPIGELSLFDSYLVIGQRVPLEGLTDRGLKYVIEALVRERALVIAELKRPDTVTSDDISYLAE